MRSLDPEARTECADRFLFYSEEAAGRGGARRTLSIARALTALAPDASILIATSTEEAERSGVPASVDLLTLPALRKTGNERYRARKLQLRWPEIRELRAEILAAAVTSFRPSVLLVDGQPLGAGGELCMALDAARVRGVHAVLRARDGVAEIPGVYDHVLVYGRSHARLTARHLLEIAASGRESGGPG